MDFGIKLFVLGLFLLLQGHTPSKRTFQTPKYLKICRLHMILQIKSQIFCRKAAISIGNIYW